MPPVAKPAPAVRGRSTTSKPLNAPKATAASSKPTRTPDASTSSVSRSASVKAGKAVEKPSRDSSQDSESASFKVTKVSSTTVTLETTWTPPSSAPAVPPPEETAQAQTSDPLQIASQIYPWSFMSSTLDACFKTAEIQAEKDLETRSKELDAEESKVSEQRDRLEAERAIEIYDELSTDKFAKEAPKIMKLFHTHGDSCARIETEALKLAMNGSAATHEEEPLKPYNDMLEHLQKLQNDAAELQTSIARLTSTSPLANEDTTKKEDFADDTSTARTQIIGVFAACLPVIRARVSNLSMAQELIDSALENVTLSLRMESMGIEP